MAQFQQNEGGRTQHSEGVGRIKNKQHDLKVPDEIRGNPGLLRLRFLDAVGFQLLRCHDEADYPVVVGRLQYPFGQIDCNHWIIGQLIPR